MDLPQLTPELMIEALNTSHNKCDEKECIHAVAIDPIIGEIRKRLVALAMDSMANGLESGMALFFYGLHAGYRLHELQLEKDMSPSSLQVN